MAKHEIVGYAPGTLGGLAVRYSDEHGKYFVFNINDNEAEYEKIYFDWTDKDNPDEWDWTKYNDLEDDGLDDFINESRNRIEKYLREQGIYEIYRRRRSADKLIFELLMESRNREIDRSKGIIEYYKEKEKNEPIEFIFTYFMEDEHSDYSYFDNIDVTKEGIDVDKLYKELKGDE